MNRKRLLSSALLTTSLFLLACGDGGGSDENDVEDAEAEEQEVVGDDIEDATELDFWTFAGTHADFFVNAAESWNEENPDRAIQLNAETYPFDQMHNNVLLSLQSGEGAPDIVDLEIARFPNYLEGETQLEPLNDLIDDEIDNFIEERLDIYGDDGNYYGAPTHLGATVVYYNTEYMDEAGVDIDDIETWDDYVEAGHDVVESTGVPMTTLPPNWYGFWPFIAQRGSDIFDEDGELIINNETNVETLQFLRDMIHEEEIAELTPGAGYQEEEFYGFMNDGGQASIIVPLFYMKDFIEYMPDLEGQMEIRPMPVFEEGDAQSVGMGGTGTAVTNQAEDVDLAKDFLYHAKLSYEGNVNLWTELGFDPPRTDVWDDEELEEDNEYFQYFDDTIFDMLLEIEDDVEGTNMNENIPNALDELGDNILHFTFREDSMTPEEALEQGEEIIRSYMDN